MDPASLALSLFLVTPCRWVDTRTDACIPGGGWPCPIGAYEDGESREYMVQAAAQCVGSEERPIPLGANALLVQVSATEATGQGHLVLFDATLWPVPLASMLSFQPGRDASNVVVIGLGQQTEGVPGGTKPLPDFEVLARVADSGTVHVKLALLGYWMD